MIKIGLTDYTPENKIIDVRDKNQVIKAKYAIGKDDILKYTLMNEHYIEISFELNRNATFKRSDYIEWEGEKYTLREDYQPEQVNKRKYKYTLKFEAIEMFFQDIQYYYLNQGLKESEWRLTGNPEYFIKIAVDNVNRYFGTTDFKVGTIEPTEIKDITFEVNTNTFNALTQVADDYGAEWYITGKTIHLLNKVSFGDEVDFETEVSVLSMKREKGEGSVGYTRIVALGSTRNIPNNYRGSSNNEAVDAIYPKRLRIPTSKGDVIDAYPNMSPDEVVEGTVIFDEVYPKRIGTIEAVGTIEYQDVNEDTSEVSKWNAYKFKDSGINFKEEYMLPGQELKLQFVSGDLNGRDFALKFHPKGFSSSDNSQFYEIYRTDEFGKLLPNDVMKPKTGDKYVLYGFNIALVSDQYVPAGELELYDVATTWQQKQLRDTGVYECPTVIKHFKDNQMDLAIGQKVRLIKDIGNSRNLIRNSKLLFTGSWGGGFLKMSNKGDYLRFDSLGNRADAHAYFSDDLSGTYTTQSLIIGQEYILSADIRTNAKQYRAGFRKNPATQIFYDIKDTPVRDTWFRHTQKIVIDSREWTGLLWLVGINDVVSTEFYVEVKNWKLEKGNKATDWTPAPEDVNAIRSSRIMGFEKKLNNKFDAIYTVGDNSTYSRFGKIEQQIKELQVAGIVYESTGGNGVYIIKQFDSTRPTDFNVYSAQASDAKYFNKQTGGTVQGDTTFDKNMQVQGTAIGDVFQNSTFTAGQFGSGFQIKRDANGQSYMEVDNLLVRRETVFNRLTIAEIKSVGGTILLSLANMVLSKVEVKASTWKCFFDTSDGTIPNDYAVGDQAICRKFTGKDIKYYWALVTAVGADYIELSKTDKDGSGIPAIGDEVVQLGNRNDVNRQYAIMLSAYGSAAPSINQYAGINSYDLTGKEVTTISPKGNSFTGSFTVSTHGTTAPVYKERGVFVNGTTYYLDDRVSYLGSYWVCIVNTTITTPSEGSSTWRKDTAGQTDINNAINDIQVGARNLIRGTSKPYFNQSLWATNGWSSTRPVWNDTENAIEFSATNGWQSSSIALTQPATNNEDISISFKAKQKEGFDVVSVLLGVNDSTIHASTKSFIPTSEWVEHKFTFKATGSRFVITVRGVDGSGKSYKVLVKDLMFEKGNKASSLSDAPEDIQGAIEAAQEKANQAKTDADKANSVISDIASDNKLTPNEKQETKKEWDAIVSEYPKNIAQANKFSVSTTAYTNAYNALNSYITPLLANLGTTSDINGATFRATFKAYYDARTDLLNAISTKAKDLADKAQTTADNAQKEAEKVRTEYKADFIILDTKIASKVSQTDFNALGQRVSTSESNIIQLSDSITSVVETVENIQVGGKNLVDNSQGVEEVGGDGIDTYEKIKNTDLYADLVEGETYTFQCKTDGIWGNGHGTDTVEAYVMLNKSASSGYFAWMSSNPCVFKAPKTGKHYIRIDSNKGSVKHKFWEFQIEKGNKATDWGLSQNDINKAIQQAEDKANKAQTDATNAQNTANLKNRTYYQDAVPTAPSGGHKVGDLWYKTSLVDSSGNINADTSKNIYQLQYRWDGTTWRQINWSVSRSKIEQTDNSITMVVEKTGINSVGASSSLYSMILQTEDKIVLEVSKVQVGGRNLIRGTSKPYFNQSLWATGGWSSVRPVWNDTENAIEFSATNGWQASSIALTLPATNNEDVSISFKAKQKEGFDIVPIYLGVNNNTSWITTKSFTPTSEWVEHKFTFKATGARLVITVRGVDGSGKSYKVLLKDLMFEKGNKSSTHSDAPEDIQGAIDEKTTLDEVSSSLTINDNKITLASKTIELTGTTIAESIKAGRIEVGNLTIEEDGTLKAVNGEFSGVLKGVTGSFKRLQAIDDNGTSRAEIGFSPTEGKLYFEGDMQHQGYDRDKQRSYRFLTSDLWCRGNFGAWSSNVLYIQGSYGYYYPKGLGQTGRVYVGLQSKVSSNNITYYEVPLYGTVGDASGFPVDMVIINTSSEYTYLLGGAAGKQITVINSNDRVSTYVFSMGNRVGLVGGAVRHFYNIDGFYSPSLASNIIGQGWVAGAVFDNTWS